ncbi:DNA internalization-related competence protein ComEC/Rec2 [Virgibacillus siamensis]|uniref:DNA internalization-related competence protein ComEC/Rec2 n=1 Tax=Virgibacillus siamensis TaxID=480071 RepID=UPI001FE3A2F4|nr:DNA internalization-related competence protein ComEC/Rec2 [Virgibacillus siamensis]
MAALAALSSYLAVIFKNEMVMIVLLVWLILMCYRKRLPKVPLILSVFCCMFFYVYIPDLDSMAVKEAPDMRETVQISGRISGPVKQSPKMTEFIFKNHTDMKYQVVYFKNDQINVPNLKYGAQCILSGTAELPDTARNPGQFDYRKFLLSKGITYQLIIASPEDIVCQGSSLLNHVYQLRGKLIAYVTENVSPVTAAWINALVLGDDSQLGDETTAVFQRWNLSHLLAISGLHIGLIVGLVYFILVKLTIFTKEKAQTIMIYFLPCYAFLAGGEPSVWRASLMVILFLFIGKARIKISATDVLSIVFLTLMTFNKFIVYNVGFQLSFLVTFGLLLSGRWLLQSNSSFWAVTKISFVAQMLIIPLQISYFSTFHPLSILLNLMIVPYFSIIVIPFLFILLLLSPLQIFTPILDSLFSLVHPIVVYTIHWIDQMAYYPFVIGTFSLTAAFFYYVAFFMFMYKLQLTKWRQAFRYGCCMTLLIAGIAAKPYLSPIGEVTMLDIGQGDAIVIELPYRKGVIMIDAGARMSFEDQKPTDTVYKQVIKAFLYEKGIRKIDAVFISHADMDHMGSIPFLLQEMDVRNVFVNNYYVFEQSAAESLKENNTHVERIGADDIVRVAGQQFRVLSPYSDQGSTNENSLVLYSEIGGYSWLFTGDIGEDTEKEISSRYSNLKVDILKVAHHGSKSSTDPHFLKQFEPTVALISAGVNNAYGHPHAEVLTDLKKAHVTIIRTDKKGAIEFRFNNMKGTFTTYLP